jgi:uncharacterized membrane protein YGL010W
MKSAVEQLSTYKSVHLNKKNVKTHFVGVPMIVWSVMVLFSLIELPILIGEGVNSTPLTFAMISLLALFIYYFMLHVSLAVGQVLFLIPLLYSAHLVSQMPHAGWIALAVLFVGWVIQFLGHHYEKAKPAFVDDMNQLLIGPFFLMAELFFMLGAQKKLEAKITPIAIQKRRAFEAAKNDATA